MSVYPGPEEPRGASSGGTGEQEYSNLAQGSMQPSERSAWTEPGGTGPHSVRIAEPAARAIALERENRILRLAFAPLHKRAFGIAVGVACAVFIFVFTALHVMFEIPGAPRIELLRAYFLGYEVSWRGAIIGTVWAFWSGFVAGWFVAFGRNLIVAISMFMTRTRAELNQTREFLDHI